MYDVENVASFCRMQLASQDEMHIHIRSFNKMAAMGYVYTLGKQTLHSPERCTSVLCQVQEARK